MRKIKVFVLLLLIVAVTTTSLPLSTKQVDAATVKEVTAEEFIKLIVDAGKVKVDKTEKDPYISAALREGFVKVGEFSSYKGKLKMEDAAVIACRVDESLHGTSYNEFLYSEIKNKNRISDLSKVAKEKQDSVIKVFSKGIMIGYSNGSFSQDRQFKGKSNIPLSTAKLICNRTVNKAKRRKLSPDGQLIRTTNLPKSVPNKRALAPTTELPYTVKGSPSAKDYPYILESFSNAFYQQSFGYQNARYGVKPVEMKDYASPAKTPEIVVTYRGNYKVEDFLAANLDTWVKKVETNLEKRLNVDYRTVDSKWQKELKDTYINLIYRDERVENGYTTEIKDYVAAIKKNKVIITGKVSVEPSTVYRNGGYYIRSYVKFKVESGNNLNDNGEGIVFGGFYIPNLKKGVWYERYVDISLGTNVGGSTGEDYKIYRDTIW